MLELSKALLAKAIELDSITIDSPTDRVNDDGVAIRPTLYFNLGVSEVNPKTGKARMVPSKKSTLYTPNKDEAAALKANVDIVETVKLAGKSYRFLKSTLTEDERKELKHIKGMLKANDTIIKIKKAVKAATSAYIMGLDKDNRLLVANAIAAQVSPALEILRNGPAKDEDLEPLFS